MPAASPWFLWPLSSVRLPARFAVGLAISCAIQGGAAFAQSEPTRDSVVSVPEASGTVFVDLDGDGRREVDEPGVPGATVSNGRDVVRTDRHGAYRLPLAEGDILFLSKPSGYAVPLGSDGLPRFYRIHQPGGTPSELGLRFPGVEAKGPLPQSLDFPLRKQIEPEDFTALVLADPQVQTMAELDYFRDDILSEIHDAPVAFGLVAGDAAYDDLSLFDRYIELMTSTGISWFHAPGNHDVNYLAPDDRRSLETYKAHFGPPYYSFDFAKVHFVVLDTVIYAGRSDRNPWGSGGYYGGVEERQLAWLANDLALVPPDRLVIVVAHIPFAAIDNDHSATFVDNRAAVFEILSRHPRILSLAGHMHVSQHVYFGASDGFSGAASLHQHSLSAAAGGWWSGPLDERGIPIALQSDGTPNGYYFLDVRGVSASLRYKAAGFPADHQMRILVEPLFEHESMGPDAPHKAYNPPIPVARLPAMEVIVNLFDGGERSRVAMRIGERTPVAMTRSKRIDPFYARLDVPDNNTFWVRTEHSSHIWVAALPHDLEPGVHRISIEADDEYGQHHSGHRLIEVTP